jgi:hypothetical protein
MSEDPGHGATEFLKDLYAAGKVDAERFDTGVAGLLAAGSEEEVAAVVRSLPGPVTLTSPGRRMGKSLEINSLFGRLRLHGLRKHHDRRGAWRGRPGHPLPGSR